MRVHWFVMATVACQITIAAQRMPAQGPTLRAGITQPIASSPGTWELSFQQQDVQPNHWKEGALRGAGIGTAIGLVLFVLTNEFEVRHRGMIIFVPAAVGAVIGGMIGASSPK